MCKSASFVLTKTECYFSTETDSHEGIGEAHGVPMMLAGRNAVVFVEARPTGVLTDWEKWEIEVDTPEDDLPTWFADDRETHLNRARATIPHYVKAKFKQRKGGGLEVIGGFTVHNWGKEALAEVVKISGDLTVYGRATLKVLTKCGNLTVYRRATLKADALAECGDLTLRNWATLDAAALTQCGELYVGIEATLKTAALTQCGDLNVSDGATLDAAALTKCRHLTVWGSLHAPALKTVNGKPYRQEG